MVSFQNSLPFALLLAISIPAYAQETTPADPAPTSEDADQETTTTISDLSLGENVDDAPKLGETYVSETIGAWEMRCVVVDEGSDPCQMYQLLAEEQETVGGQADPVAEFSMFRLPDGQQAVAGATVIVPLETSLQAQLTISVDGAKGKRYPYSFCTNIGCYARIGLTQQDIDAFKQGNRAALTIVPARAPDQEVVAWLSLEGFTASYELVSVLEP
ncbi:MAG: invasion associated locus B family protein [Paracoccaceae bacterium]